MTDVVVLGIGADGAYAHREYAAAHNIQFPLLADTNGRVSRAYGVLVDEFEGHRNVPGRATFVVDSDRVVQFAWAAQTPADQPDLDALRRATTCRDDQCAADDPGESA